MNRHGRDGDLGDQASGFIGGFIGYLRTRQPEHWLFFAVGVIFGILIG